MNMQDVEQLRSALGAAHPREEIDLSAVERLLTAYCELHELVNHPQTADFLQSTRLEVVHHVQRWGTVHDRAKQPADWFWLLGYLSGKALTAHLAGNTEKALHHTISSAAVLANWHLAIKVGSSAFTPGSSDIQAMVLEIFGPVVEMA